METPRDPLEVVLDSCSCTTSVAHRGTLGLNLTGAGQTALFPAQVRIRREAEGPGRARARTFVFLNCRLVHQNRNVSHTVTDLRSYRQRPVYLLYEYGSADAHHPIPSYCYSQRVPHPGPGSGPVSRARIRCMVAHFTRVTTNSIRPPMRVHVTSAHRNAHRHDTCCVCGRTRSPRPPPTRTRLHSQHTNTITMSLVSTPPHRTGRGIGPVSDMCSLVPPERAPVLSFSSWITAVAAQNISTCIEKSP